MFLTRIIVLFLYFATLGGLALYGFHKLYLLLLLRRHQRRRPRGRAEHLGSPEDAGSPSPPPAVTVQIPIYNEVNVAPRLIEAVGRLDYPRDLLEIQVLDDSTDDTRVRVASLIGRLRGEGLDIHHLHRSDRAGFKAGALDAGLRRARGELIAVFDADFVPDPRFLRETVPHFRDPRVGMVQARWGHLNRNYSLLTRVQALLLDGHFLIEHAARHLAGRFFNFNGTAGVWRRRCIEEAGGWQHDTLTEDLDLSYRAQLAGWRFVFLPMTVAPAELPVELSAFRGQQHRWAKGSIQTARKLLPRILASRLPWPVRAEASFHLTANFGHFLMVLLAILIFPAMLLRADTSWPVSLAIDLPVFVFTTGSFWIFYACAEVQGQGRVRRALGTMPFLMVVGVGLSLNNARAVMEGLFGGTGIFERTPKLRIEDGSPTAPARRYRAKGLSFPWLEALFSLHFTLCMAVAARSGLWAFFPFLVLFWSGFTYMALGSLAENLRNRRPPAALGAGI